MLTFSNFLNRPEFATWHAHISERVNERSAPGRHGDIPKWMDVLSQLPDAIPSIIDLQSDTITIGSANDLTHQESQTLRTCLEALIPWRKGPFNLFGIEIDTEWKSDWKWQRLQPHVSSLQNKRVLDIGCGTGYHCWRMLGAGADTVLGIDPSMRFVIQHAICQHYIQSQQFDFLPLGIEDLPNDMSVFDSIFSMGILYHRRDPLQHLKELRSLLAPSGELILETLIIDEDFEHVENGLFVPEGRYAQMRNVWNLPTVSFLENSLNELGFDNVRCVDINTTSLSEQRTTPWTKGHSLVDFLDPTDHTKTIEGLPAPKRAIVVASKN